MTTKIDKTILGGAKRSKMRPRGFIDNWNLRDETRTLLVKVQDVLDEYAEHLPLTIRQIFYRLVGTHGYEKTEQAYENLSEKLNRARRSRMIPFDAIRDDGGQYDMGALGYDDAEDFMARLRRTAALPPRPAARPTDEACPRLRGPGLVPQLESVATDYGVPVISGGGFDLVTAKYSLAEDLAAYDSPVEVLHIGDHDPSGAHIFLALKEDVQAFVSKLGGEVEFHRLAVTPTQVKRLKLPTAPPKKSDKRAFHGKTCQAEAIAPDDLARIVRDAIEARTDKRKLDRVLRREKRERAHWSSG